MTKVELLKYLQKRAVAEQKFYDELKEHDFDFMEQAKSMESLAKIMLASSVVYMH